MSFQFRLCGTVEFGQVTIIAEEVDRLDENSSTMSVLKEGYQLNARVPRMNSDNTKMDFFNPFCFKILIAEKSHRDDRAKCVIDRSFRIKSYKGSPTKKQ